ATHVLSNYGAVDYLTDPLLTVQDRLVALANSFLARGLSFAQCTFTPRTTSTDYWTTAQNQTPLATEASRLAINRFLRDCSAAGFRARTLDPVRARACDVAAAVEVDATNTLAPEGGRWLARPSAQIYSSTAGTTYTTVDGLFLQVVDSGNPFSGSGKL